MSALTCWRDRLSDFGIRSLGAVATGNLVKVAPDGAVLLNGFLLSSPNEELSFTPLLLRPSVSVSR